MQKANGMELVPRAGAIVRDDFAGQQITKQAETAASAVAAREQAAVQARYIMAERHARNWDTVRVRVLGHCERPRFAEVAKYRKPAGRKFINGEWREQHVEGLSARFAETAAQEMGNLMPESAISYEDDLIRIVRASVTDLERNVTFSQEITVAKAVERKGKRKGDDWQPPEGRDVLSSRLNSQGEPTYLVRATDDELRIKQAAEVSKAQRNFMLKLLPRDIQEEALERIEATLRDPKKTDPTQARKRLIDAFAAVGVLPDDLAGYVGGPLERISPAQVEELRGLYTAIRDGETTFQDALKAKYAPSDGEETEAQHDARLQSQMKQQEVAARKIAEMEEQKKEAAPADPAPTSDDPPAQTPTVEPPQTKPKLQFGKGRVQQ